MPIPTLAGQRVVVIGGSSGIGFAVAEAAAAEGARVFVGSSQAAKVEAAVAKLGGAAGGAAVDVKDEASIDAFLTAAGAFDHLVFTAGDWGSVRFVGPLASVDFETAPAALGVRFWGAMKVARQAQGRITEGGSITLTSGVMAHRPQRGAPLTTAFGGATEHLVRGLAAELAPVRVNGVCPGLIMTEVVQAMPQERLKAFVDRQLLRRPGQPEEAAQAYIYLMKGAFTTGQVIVVDGGILLT